MGWDGKYFAKCTYIYFTRNEHLFVVVQKIANAKFNEYLLDQTPYWMYILRNNDNWKLLKIATWQTMKFDMILYLSRYLMKIFGVYIAFHEALNKAVKFAIFVERFNKNSMMLSFSYLHSLINTFAYYAHLSFQSLNG